VIQNPIIITKNILQNLEDLETRVGESNLSRTAVVLIDDEEGSKLILNRLKKTSKSAQVQWFASEDIINVELNSSLKDLANQIKLSGTTFTTTDSDFFVYYENISRKLLENGAKEVNPYTLNTWDTLWLLTEVYKENIEILFHNTEVNETEVSEHLKSYITTVASKTVGTMGSMHLDKYGDKENVNLTYYSYVNSKWLPRGYYKVIPFEPPALVINDINTSTTVKAINTVLKVGVIANDETWAKDADKLVSLASKRINEYFKDSNYSIKLHLANNSIKPYSEESMLKELTTFQTKGIKTVITLVSSELFTPMQQYASDNDMIILDCGNTAMSNALNDTTFRLIPNDTHEVNALIYQLDKEGIENVLIIDVNNLDQNNFRSIFESKYTGTVLNTYLYAKGNTIEVKAFGDETVQMSNENSAILFFGEKLDAIGLESLEGPVKDKVVAYKWFGTHLIEFNEEFKRSGLDITFVTHDYRGFGYFMPQHIDLNNDVQNSALTNYAINAYDAVWLAALRNYDVANFSNSLTDSLKYNSAQIYGISGLLGFDINGDRATSSFAFYNLVNNLWTIKSIYNNTAHGITQINE
jgi:ABC-type branched-subunit amino acid transport system substrate-binding protein